MKRNASALLALLAIANVASAEEPTMSVAANRNQIYLGESVQLDVKITGTDKAEPDLSSIQNCTVKFLGSQSFSRGGFSFTVIVNGRVQHQSSSSSSRTFSYAITPATAGRFTAGPVKLTVDGRTLSDPGPAIDVSVVETQDRVSMTVASSREAVLVDEPFTVTLSILMKRLHGRYADFDPVDPRNPPALTVPFLDGQAIQGLDAPNVKEILQQHLVSGADQPGFGLNNYAIRNDPFSNMNMFNFNFDDFMRERPAKFRFDRRAVDRSGQSYFEYSLNLTYTPREEGSHTFGPAVFKGTVAMGVDAGNRLVGRPIFAVGPACTVRVVPPPEQGRPPSFIGAIGSNMLVKATLDAQTCNVGDPLTLTLAVSGAISMDNLYPPALSAQADLTRDFKVYDDTVQTSKKDGARIFTYTLRPARAGTPELPPIELAFYDVGRSAYRIERTAAIPLRVNEAVQVDSGNVLATVTNRAADRAAEGRAQAVPVGPMTMDPAGAEPQRIASAPLYAAMAAGPLCWLLVVGAQQTRRRMRRAAQARKRHGALRRANAELQHAEKTAGHDQAAARLRICDALRRYLSDRFDVAAATITPVDARGVLQAHGMRAELSNRLCGLLERNFNAAYAQGAAPASDPAGDAQAARETLQQIEAALAERSKDRGVPDEEAP